MRKIVLSVTSATALFAGVATANEYKDYVISLKDAPIASLASARSNDTEYSRLSAIYSLNHQIAYDASVEGVNVRSQLETLGAISFAEMTEDQARALRKMGYQVEPQVMYHLVGVEQPFPGITAGQFETFSDDVPYGISKIKADQVWSSARSTGSGVKTCIIDTGMDRNHEDLASNYVRGTRTVGGSDPSDGNGHGTHVAGTVAANLNGNGIVGVAPEADLYIAAVFGSSGSTTEEAILQGLDWCVAQNTQVANMSYGGSSNSSASERAYQEAYQAGLVMVAATGNSGSRTPIGYPAAYDTTIAVGATDRYDRIADFSQRGSQIDVVAPGVGVVSANVGGGTQALSGTSMATPHVTGAVAALLGRDSSLSIEEIRNLLRDTADDLGASGWDSTYGAGRINLKRAIESLSGGGVPDNRPPSAAFNYTADLLDVDFNENASDSDGYIASYSWSFGDGYGSSSASPSHTYSSAGTYTVSLTVTDDDGASKSVSQQITVADGSAPDIEIGVTRGGFWLWGYDNIVWSGARTNNVDIYRNGSFLTQTANDGSYRYNTQSAGASYIVCEAGSTIVCSEPASN